MALFTADTTVLPADIALPENRFFVQDRRARRILEEVEAVSFRPDVIVPLRILLAEGCVQTAKPRAGTLAVMGAANWARDFVLPVGLGYDLESGHAWAGILEDESRRDHWESVILSIRSLGPECPMIPEVEDFLDDIVIGMEEPPPAEALPELLSHPNQRMREWALKLVPIAS